MLELFEHLEIAFLLITNRQDIVLSAFDRRLS